MCAKNPYLFCCLLVHFAVYVAAYLRCLLCFIERRRCLLKTGMNTQTQKQTRSESRQATGKCRQHILFCSSKREQAGNRRMQTGKFCFVVGWSDHGDHNRRICMPRLLLFFLCPLLLPCLLLAALLLFVPLTPPPLSV